MTNKIKNLKLMKNNQGQIAIIVLLASAILLTLGMSASRKTITDTKVDTDEELLKEAFNTAESGINNYLNSGSASYDPGDGSQATVSSVDIGNANSISTEGQAQANSPQIFWLVDHNPDGTINGNYYTSNFDIEVDSTFKGALKIDYFYLDAANAYRVQRLGYNFGGSNIVSNYTNSASNEVTMTFTAGTKPLLVLITPLSASTPITLSGAATFPKQGEELTSVGTANNGVKTQVKTRNIYQIPSFFFEAITAGNEIK